MCRKWIYLACAFALLGLLPASVTHAADESLVGWWKLDETSGFVAHDSSGCGNHGMLHGDPQWTGRGLEFDGDGDYVDCGDGPSLNISGSVTITAWIRLDGPAGDRKIAGNQDGITGGYKFGIYGDRLEFEIRTADNVAILNRSVAGGMVLEPGMYHHVAGVYSEGDSIRTYVDGVLDRELSTAELLGTSTGTFKLGREPFSDAYSWLGLMEDVRVYDTALDQDEIQQLLEPGDEQEFFEEYPAWNMPELAVTDLTVQPERVDPGDRVVLRATVSAIGTGNTQSATLAFLVDGVEIDRVSVEPLVAGAEQELRTTWLAEESGLHHVLAQLELSAGTFDRGFENNARTGTARVSGARDPVPELEVGDIGFDAMQLIAGESYVVPVTIRNPGLVDIWNVPVMIYVDGELMGDGVVEYLPPGEQQELRFLWEAVTPGEHTVAVEMILPDEFPDYLAQAVKGWHVVIADTTVTYDLAMKHKWASLGPRELDNGDVGRITCFAIDPTAPSVMYAGGWGRDGSIHAAPGVWKTTNGGQNWLPVGDKLPSMMISSVAVDPQTTNNIYAGTPFNGIFKSTDGGSTWDLFAGPQITGNYVTELIVRSEAAPSDPRVLIYAATQKGVLRYKGNDPAALTSLTSDWDNIKTGVITDLAVHPIARSTVFASVENEGLYRTEKGITARDEPTSGVHDWTKTGAGLPTISGWNGLTMDIFRSNPAYMYAGVSHPRSGIHFAIYRSKDWGNTFELVKEYANKELPGRGDGGIYNPFIRVHPTLVNMVYFGGIDLFKWSAYSPPPGKTSWTYKVNARFDLKALEFLPPGSPEVYYLACDQGMFRYTPSTTPTKHYLDSQQCGLSGDTYQTRNYNLRVTEFYDVDVATSSFPLIIGGTQDTGTVLYDGSPDWRYIRGGDGYYSPIAPSDSSVMYTQHQGLVSTCRSGDGGGTWQCDVAANKGLPQDAEGRLLSNGYITVDPHYPNTVLAACASGDTAKGGEVYATTDAHLGQNCTWTARGPFGTTVKGSVTRVVIQPVTTHWFAGTSKGQIWYTSAKIRGTWNQMDAHPDQATVINMAFSPKDPHVLYVLYWGGDPYTRVQRFEWTLGGGWNGSWMTDNLDVATDPRVICGDAHRSDVAYVGTDHGIFRWDGTQPTYASWKAYNDGFPLTTVVDLKVGPDETLYAATKGRGVWGVLTGP
ncbi:MAG: hypothetical protein JSW27_22855 [Phycisphaerales bacterium]|nr:MAG: hypothetical protein JSW27_22855 [Phycisphaerales bacterium]